MVGVLESSLGLPEEEQRFYHRGVSWERFQAIQKGFEHLPGECQFIVREF